MRVAIIGSRGLNVKIEDYIPEGITELVSGGAAGIDTLAEKYADEHNLAKLILKPQYNLYGKQAPLIRNQTIVDCAELVIAIWDGISRGTKYTIDYAKKTGKPVKVYIIEKHN